MLVKQRNRRTFLAVQWLGLHMFPMQGMRVCVLVWRTKIPHATEGGQKINKTQRNRKKDGKRQIVPG